MRLQIISLILLLALVNINPVQAQNEWWEDGCDTRIMSTIAATTDVLDYESACQHYRECDPRGEGDFACQIQTLDYMVQQCAPEDQHCSDGAILMAAAILAFDMPFGESIDWIPSDSIIENVPLALTAYWQGDDEAALAAYNKVVREEFDFDTMIPISRAVLHQRLNQPEDALQQYATVFSITFDQPLAWYARTQLHGSLGRNVEASLDVVALESYAQTNEADIVLLDDLKQLYPQDDGVWQNWNLYPVSTTGSGVAGNYLSDLLLEPPRPIQLAIYPELNLIAGIGLQNWGSSSMFEPTYRLQVLTDYNDDNTYGIGYPAFYDNSGAMSLTVDGDVLRGFEFIYFFEGGGEWNFVLAPADAPDPRPATASNRYCEGSVQSRVGVGMRVDTVEYYQGLQYADSPGGELIHITSQEYSSVSIIGGPECVDGTTWWQIVLDAGAGGWVAENQDNTYMITEITHIPELFFCELSPSPRLQAGKSARVLEGLGENNIRELPNTDGKVIGAIPAGQTFQVLGGPTCGFGLVWWYVDYNGVRGWTAEGQETTYWLEPVIE